MKPGLGQQVATIPQRGVQVSSNARWARVFPLIALACLCGCSTFNRDWKRAAQQPAVTNSIEGRWDGKWLSDVNAHTGRLRCLLTRESDTRYQARFRATYWKIFRYSYAVPLEFGQRDGVWHFKGEENLGKLAGGVYRYEGHVSPTNFFSTYHSKYDHGTFQMQRPE